MNQKNEIQNTKFPNPKSKMTSIDAIVAKATNLYTELQPYTEALKTPTRNAVRNNLDACTPEIRDEYYRTQRFIKAVETLNSVVQVIRCTLEISYEEHRLFLEALDILKWDILEWVSVQDQVDKIFKMIRELRDLLSKNQQDKKQHEKLISKKAFDELVTHNAKLDKK